MTDTLKSVPTSDLTARRARTNLMLNKVVYVQMEDGKLSGEASLELVYLRAMLRDDLRAMDAELAHRARMIRPVVASAAD